MRDIPDLPQKPRTPAQTIEQLSTLGVNSAQHGYVEVARIAFLKAAQIERRADILANAANACRVCWRFDEANSLIEEAIERAPMDGRIWATKALICLDMNQHEEAVIAFDKAIGFSGETGFSAFGRSQALLGAGRFAEGFAAYESRYELNAPPDHYIPRWRGEPLKNKILHVQAEQGLGDTIMFSRFLGAIQGNYVFSVQPQLLGLFPGSKRQDEEIRADYWCPLMSLPNFVGADLSYRPIQPARLMPLDSDARFNIGVFWKAKALGTGGPQELRHGAQKSCPMETFLELADIPNVRLHSLQYGEDAAASLGLINQPPLYDFADMASYISQMDLVVGVDTAPMHLVGMMNKPGVVLLNISGSWQWGSKDETIWYPSLKIVRQTKPGDWPEVMTRAKALVVQALGGAAESAIMPAGGADVGQEAHR